ncbi:MAG: MBL fold metallo-hydrolase [Spirochaetes bacterium]|nr:MBL fold metallo-hydrolase [Spirochaetota bacterium]
MNLKITILVENYSYIFPFAEWGFCAFIELNGKKYLFDTGLTGTCAIKNAQANQIDLKNIDKIILSHGHNDHTGGLEEILKFVNKKEILAHPDVFSKKFPVGENNQYFNGIKYRQEYLEYNLGAKFHFEKGFYQIADHLYMTGEVPFTNQFETIAEIFKIKTDQGDFVPDTFTDDNSLVFDTPKGLVIVVGCAHRGIVNIMTYAREKLNKKVHAIIGGTHLVNSTEKRLAFTIKAWQDENIDIIAPSHCTYYDNIVTLQNIFEKKCIPAFCGQEYDFS